MPKQNILLLIKKIISGFVVGVGGIVPGVSGSVMAVSFGIYETMIDAAANIFKDFKNSAVYLLPIGIGMLVGVFSMSNAVEWLMLHFRVSVLFLFMGFVLGGLPSVVREGNRDKGFDSRYLVATGVSFAAVLIASYFSEGDIMRVSAMDTLQPPMAFISGALLALGTIVPGISISFVLIYMGVYDALMSALNNFELATLAIVGIGFVAAALLLVKAVQKLFRKFPGYAYYAVLGFAIGSVVMILPPVEANLSLLLNLLLLAGGFAVSYGMDKRSNG